MSWSILGSIAVQFHRASLAGATASLPFHGSAHSTQLRLIRRQSCDLDRPNISE